VNAPISSRWYVLGDLHHSEPVERPGEDAQPEAA
jgi:hypothetical protein